MRRVRASSSAMPRAVRCELRLHSDPGSCEGSLPITGLLETRTVAVLATHNRGIITTESARNSCSSPRPPKVLNHEIGRSGVGIACPCSRCATSSCSRTWSCRCSSAATSRCSALEDAMAGDKQLLLAAQRRAKTDDPNEEDIFAIGTVGHIIQLLRFPKGPVKVLVEGRARARIRGFSQIDPFFVCDVDDVEEPDEDAVEIAGADALGAGRVRGLRQAQHAHPAGDARQRAHDRRAGPPRRHDRRARRAQAERQAGAARDAVAGASASSGSAS